MGVEGVAEELCRRELLDYLVYSALVGVERDPGRRRLLEAFAAMERRHYEFWRRLLGRECSVPRSLVSLYVAAYRLLGPAFVLKLLERGEGEAARLYERVLEGLEGEARREAERILREEAEIESRLLAEVRDARLHYLGYVALGLADAIVELTGVNAGFLGATSSTLMAGLASLVVGFSAAISMASAAYLQAKHGGDGVSPGLGALVTGASYLLTVLLLAAPFFLTSNMLLAFAASLATGLGLTAALTYYTAVVQEKSFTREYAESAGLLLLTAAAGYAFGELLKRVFGFTLAA